MFPFLPMNRTPLFLFAFLGMALSAYSQPFTGFQPFRSFNLVLNAQMYRPGEYLRQSGSQDMEVRWMPSGQVGVQFHILNRARSWELNTGLMVGAPPIYWHRFTLPEDQLDYNFDSDLLHYESAYSISSLSIPLQTRFKFRPKKMGVLTAGAGLQVMFLAAGVASTSMSIGNESGTQQKTLFYMEVENPLPNHYWSGNLELGHYFINRWGLFHLTLQYHRSFNDLFAGEFRFQNLTNTADTYGQYRLRGNFLAVGLSYTWRRKEFKNS